MSDEQPAPPTVLPTTPEPPAELKNEARNHFEGLTLDHTGEESVDAKLAQIEMIGEEAAAGWKPTPHVPLSPEVRFLHISRTIHQLITDRNRSVGIFLGVASLLFAASTALLNARPDVVPIIPLKSIQYWCLPVTFGTLAIIGIFMGLILVRTRIGLIFEVSKMNTLLSLPAERVRRVNPFSIFFLMYLLVSLLGAACAGLTAGMLMPDPVAAQSSAVAELDYGPETPRREVRVPILVGCAVGFLYLSVFLTLYYGMILRATSEARLQEARP